MKKIKIVLVGNTNAGKTSFLNTICGLSKETSNYPGTTVELFKSTVESNGVTYEIIDLPGVYSLNPFSIEEKVTRKILQEGDFDIAINLIDPNFKKRSLSFTLELMELEIPLFVVINNKNNDLRQSECFLRDLEKKLFLSGICMNVLKKESKQLFFNKIQNQIINTSLYKKTLEEIHNPLKNEIKKLKEKYKLKNLWEILKILERDCEIIKDYEINDYDELFKEDKDYSLEIKKNRFSFLENNLIAKKGRQFNCGGCGNYGCPNVKTDKIDNVFLNKWFGIPIFLFLMWVIFQVTFSLGAIPMEFFDGQIALLQKFLSNILPQNLWSSVLVDGVIGGVGATLIFLPPIMFLFFFLSILGQSGYLARTAYLFDYMMQKIGLSGKSFIPLLMGFGCSVPAIMATRTLMSKKEKIITSMMIPFMSCGAKLPIYTLFISAFFEERHRGSVLFIIYIFGILMGIFSGLFFNKFIKDKKRPLLLELPVYTIPKLKNIWKYVWGSAKEFLYKAGRVILPFSIVLWILFSFPMVNNKTVNIENSYAATIGKTVEPVLKPLGFDWRISTGLIAGLGAKEIFTTVLGTMYSLEEENKSGLILKLQNDPVFTPLSVISLLIFVLIYTPCMATISILKQEFGIKWAIIGLVYPTVLAWLLSFLVYQIGSALF